MSLFLFIRYFVGAILSKKSCQKRGFRKKDKKGDGHITFKLSAHFAIMRCMKVITFNLKPSVSKHSYFSAIKKTLSKLLRRNARKGLM